MKYTLISRRFLDDPAGRLGMTERVGVQFTPSPIERFFRVKPRTEYYTGSGTVWRHYRGGRVGSFFGLTEYRLVELLAGPAEVDIR